MYDLKNKENQIVWILSLLLLLSLSAVPAFSMGNRESIKKAEQITINWGDVLAANHPSVQMINKVARIVTEKSDGRIIIRTYSAGQLGGSQEMIKAVTNGIQQMVTEGSGNFAPWVSSIGIIEAPYVWRDVTHMLNAMNGAIGQQFNEKLISSKGIRILGTTYYGMRHLSTTKKKVEHVADMKNFKLRIPENEIFMAMAESWGAKPSPINFNELYLALKTNVVDGQENPLPTIDSAKLYEVQKYIILTGHIITPRLVVINEDFYQSLTSEDQKILQDAITKTILWQNGQILKQEKELISQFKNRGVIIIQPTVEEFRQAVLSVVPQKLESKWGAGMWEKIQAAK